jgi:hypothetical protein
MFVVEIVQGIMQLLFQLTDVDLSSLTQFMYVGMRSVFESHVALAEVDACVPSFFVLFQLSNRSISYWSANLQTAYLQRISSFLRRFTVVADDITADFRCHRGVECLNARWHWARPDQLLALV